MLIQLLILAVVISLLALLYARWEYRKRGKLTLMGLLLLCVMLFIPNLMLEYATRYRMPGTFLGYIGIVSGLAGLAILLWGVKHFRSIPKMLCLDTGDLT